MDLFNFIKQATPILEVITDHVPLRQIGNYWKGPCPFHAETDASFTVSPEKEIFYCFGCHTTGDVIGFVAKLENMTQLEAAHMLVEQRGLEVPEKIKKEYFKKEGSREGLALYFHMCERMAEWTHQQLLRSKTALDYLVARGVTEKEIKLFTLGYFPGGVASTKAFTRDLSNQGVLVKDLLDVGILIESRSFLHSSFEDRIIFPIKDHLGRFCGFGGRVFKPKDERAKYYNSKESDGFAKSKLLFGLDLAKKSIQTKKAAFLVEGYTDCVAMVQHGYDNTVATLGTACTLDHLKLLSRYTSLLYLLYDGDKAGQKAILRIAHLCWEVNLELRVVMLPSKEDPASFLSAGGNLDELVGQSLSIFTFFIELMCTGFANETLAKKMDVAKKIIEMIALIKDVFKQDLLLQQAALEMQLPFDTLKNLFTRHKSRVGAAAKSLPSKNQDQKILQKNDEEDEISLLEEKIFSAILKSSCTATKMTIDPEMTGYFSSRIQHLITLLDNVYEREHSQLEDKKRFFDKFLAHLKDDDRNWVIKVSMKFDHVAVSQEFFNQLVFRFYRHHWKHIVRDIKGAILQAKYEENHEVLRNLLDKFTKLKQGIRNRGLI